MLRRALTLLALIGLALPALGQNDGDPAGSVPRVLLTSVEGAIGPATARQISDAVATAESRNADALVLQLNTPGGLVTSTRDIIITIMGSGVPVIGYVAPSGAHAASAGTYILYATHAAGMAPATNIGAATPIQMGGGSPLPGGGQDQPAGDEGQDRPQTTDDSPKADPANDQEALKAKRLNDAVAFIRGLAEARGRNADWAEAAVRQAATLTAEAAKEKNVIEAVAGSVPALLAALDGRVVTVK